MDYTTIKLYDIKYDKYGNIKYENDKLLIKLPKMVTTTGIYQSYNKHLLKLQITDEKLYKFLQNLEEYNKRKCNKDSIYKSNIIEESNSKFLLIKIPFRYNRYEIDINSTTKYLATSSDIHAGSEIICTIKISKIWHYNSDEEKKYSGVLIECKDIELL